LGLRGAELFEQDEGLPPGRLRGLRLTGVGQDRAQPVKGPSLPQRDAQLLPDPQRRMEALPGLLELPIGVVEPTQAPQDTGFGEPVVELAGQPSRHSQKPPALGPVGRQLAQPLQHQGLPEPVTQAGQEPQGRLQTGTGRLGLSLVLMEQPQAA
jgi:hypothetical protein